MDEYVNLKRKLETGDGYFTFGAYGLKDYEVMLPSALDVKINKREDEIVLKLSQVEHLKDLLEEVNVKRLKSGFVPLDPFSMSTLEHKLGFKPLIEPCGFAFKTVGFLNFLLSNKKKDK